jgi:hypothetical protein
MERLRMVNAVSQPVRLDAVKLGHGYNQLLCLLIDHTSPEFIHLCTPAYADEELAKGNLYHISLCFAYEVRDWAAFERVRMRFSGRVGVMHVQVYNSAAYLIQDGALSSDILADRDICALHDGGFYHDRELHMSL